jgi:hypothetical protein
MKINPECVPCLLKRIIFEAEQSTNDKKLQAKVVKNACKSLSELYDPTKSSASIATVVHQVVYDTLDNTDPYKELKEISNKVAMGLVPHVKKLVKDSDKPLKTAMICSIIGNLMDFGIDGASSHPENLKTVFEQTYEQGLGYDDYDELEKMIKESKNILLFTDNCGEIVFDRILCEELKKFNKDMNLILVVKGEPIISDATAKDAEELLFEEVVDEVMTTGCFAIGVDFNKMPKELKNTLENADLIICKGMANYEAFSETNYNPIAYLLRTKCAPIANSMRIDVNINAIKLFK